MTVSQLYKVKQQHHGGINIKTEDIVLIKEDIKSQSLTDWRFGNKLEVLKENGGKVQGTKLQILSKSGTSTTCHQSLQKIKTLAKEWIHDNGETHRERRKLARKGSN